MTFTSLVLCDLPYAQISQVLSLCYAIPTSLLLSQDSGLDCFLLILLSVTQVCLEVRGMGVEGASRGQGEK
jgi:hypothetical protein